MQGLEVSGAVRPIYRSLGVRSLIEHVWNVMAHAQKPDFVFQGNGRVHLNRRGASVQSTTGSRGVRISGSNAGYTMFWGRVKDYWLPAPFACFPFTSPPVRHRVPSHFNWAIHETYVTSLWGVQPSSGQLSDCRWLLAVSQVVESSVHLPWFGNTAGCYFKIRSS
jgi:hypothetical protein